MPIRSLNDVISSVYPLLPPVFENTGIQLPPTAALHALPLIELSKFTKGPDALTVLEQWLSEGERHFLARFSLKKRRLEWLGGRLTAKASLLSLLNSLEPSICAGQLEILPDSTGRPQLAGLKTVFPGKIFFSISHSGDHAASLASLSGPCGLDIQQLSPALAAIKERFSSAEERRLLQGCPQLVKLDKIHQLALLWAAKEAYRKALPLSPLPSFLEMRLCARPRQEGSAFQLEAEFSRQNQQRNFSVTTWFHGRMAVAITFIEE